MMMIHIFRDLIVVNLQFYDIAEKPAFIPGKRISFCKGLDKT